MSRLGVSRLVPFPVGEQAREPGPVKSGGPGAPKPSPFARPKAPHADRYGRLPPTDTAPKRRQSLALKGPQTRSAVPPRTPLTRDQVAQASERLDQELIRLLHDGVAAHTRLEELTEALVAGLPVDPDAVRSAAKAVAALGVRIAEQSMDKTEPDVHPHEQAHAEVRSILSAGVGGDNARRFVDAVRILHAQSEDPA